MSIPTAGGAPTSLRIQLLGGFRVVAGAEALPETAWRARRAASLIKLLALAPDHRLHREQVMEALWPDSPPAAAARNLHYTLHVARRLLARPGWDGAAIRFRGDLLDLGPPEALWTDVAAFEAAAAAARRGRDPAGYQAALALYAGDLLPEDAYEEWTVRRREALRRAYLALLVELAQVEEAQARPAAAIAALERVVAAEPAHEAAHRGLMRLYAATGRRHEALRQYAALRAALRRELDADPDAASEQLYRAILAGDDLAPPSAVIPPVTAARPSGNLPAALTDLVGREREVAELRRLLGQTRLLTVTGAGGVGKTRLALEAARAVAGDYPDGAWLVELAALADPDLVAPAVARALAVPDEPGRPPTDVVRDRLAGRRLLLVLDNCEHLLDACARLVAAVLPACPGVRVLATSREPLRVAGEVSWRAPSLPTPPPEEAPSLAAVARYPAVALFLARARAARPDFAPAEASAPALAQLCRRLDGIPLALELAAARVTALSVEQLAARLDDRFTLLTGGGRAALPRQQTLRATLDWSHDLLSEPERALFRRLSVFAGGWTLAAAEAVCGEAGMGAGGEAGADGAASPPPGLPASPLDVLDTLARLVDRSLVQAQHDAGGETRFRLLETVRQYAGERLTASGEAEAVRARHAAYVVALVEAIEPQRWGPHEAAWLAQLEREHDNVRAALGWALDRRDGLTALRLAGAVYHFWLTRGHSREGRAWLGRSLAAADRGDDEPRAARLARATALHGAGVLAATWGDHAEAGALFRQAHALRRAAGDRWGEALSLQNVARSVAYAGDLDAARALQEEALALFRGLGHQAGVGWSLRDLGILAWEQGDDHAARRLFEESLALAREHDGPFGLILVLARLGGVLGDIGELGAARARLMEALQVAVGLGNAGGVGGFLFDELAILAARQARPARALRLFGAAEALSETAGRLPVAGWRAERDRQVAAARQALATEAGAAAWAAGRAMTLEQAVAYAQTEDEAGVREEPDRSRDAE